MDHFDVYPDLIYSEAELDEILMCRDDVRRGKKNPPPYKIVRDETVGRHMVASRNIKAGETIFIESPLTFGPSDNSKVVCLGCYKRLLRPEYFCSKCGYPMCSKRCEEMKAHSDSECRKFQQHNFAAKKEEFSFEGENSCYNVVSPLRALRMKDIDGDKWRLLWSHMSHDNKRRKSKFWSERTSDTIKQLENCIGLSNPEEIRTYEILLGILLVNDFEIDLSNNNNNNSNNNNDSQSIRGLFALASMPSHSCVANTKHDFEWVDSSCFSDMKMTMRAVVDIQKGEEITHSYADPLEAVLTRQGLLNVGKFFHCRCPRYALALRASQSMRLKVVVVVTHYKNLKPK